MATPVDLRWIDDGVSGGHAIAQSIVKKASTSNDGNSWTAPATIYDDTAHPPLGVGSGLALLDLSVGQPKEKGYLVMFGNPENQWVYIPSDSSISPVIIDPVVKPISNSGFSVTPSGPWVASSGALYLAAYKSTGLLMCVYKSTDNGATWVLKDNSHAPSFAPAGADPIGWVWDDANQLIQIVCPDASGFLALCEFSTATDTYSAIHDSNLAGPNTQGFVQVGKIGSTIFATYAVPNGSGHGECFISIFSGGSWTTVQEKYSTNIAGTTDATNCTMAVDSTRSHLFYGFVAPGNIITMFYRSCAADGTLGSIFAFPAGSGNGDLTGAPNDAIQLPYIDQAGNAIAISSRTFHPVTGDLVPGIFIGTPLSAPAWTGPIPVWDSPTAQYYGGVLAASSLPVVITELTLAFKGTKVYPQPK